MTQPNPLTGVSERIDALEGHLSQLLARQKGSTSTQKGSAPSAQPPPAPAASEGAAEAGDPATGRVVRSDLHFDDDDPDGFDERFSAFTDATEVDERSRDWLLS